MQDFCTPAMAAPPCIIDVPSCTPKSRIRMERVVQPSQYLLPPYITIRSTAHQDALYRKLIIHSRSSKVSRLKEYVTVIPAIVLITISVILKHGKFSFLPMVTTADMHWLLLYFTDEYLCVTYIMVTLALCPW